MNELISVLNQDGNLVVSSREVAKNFEKQNKHVDEDGLWELYEQED